MAFSPADVVLVPFPYRDRLAERARPGVVISAQAYNQRGDVVIAAITSHPPRVPSDHALADWAAAGLKMPSTSRMLLATVASSRILLRVGRLTDRDWSEVQTRVRSGAGRCTSSPAERRPSSKPWIVCSPSPEETAS